jgi:hypothetical protein
MKRNLNMFFLILTVGFLLVSGCNSNEQNKGGMPDQASEDSSVRMNVQHFDDFEFYILETNKHFHEPTYRCYVSFNKGNDSSFLFETIPSLTSEQLRHLFDDYYAFPYVTGGNYCRAAGINIIKIAGGAALFIGPVSGYDDIDSNGTDELYIDVATDLSGSHVNHTIEQFEVFLVNDSLVYRGIDLY